MTPDVPMKNFSSNRVLVVAAHPDDEMLGCAGTLARLKKNGSQITILLLGEGPTARAPSAALFSVVKAEAFTSSVLAAKALGIQDIRHASFPDNRFDTVPLLDLVQCIERVIEEIDPDLVLTHHSGDLNMDHQLTHRAVVTATRPLPGKKKVNAIWGFEVLSSTEYAPANTMPPFCPTIYVEISDFLMKKQKALESYASEMRPWPHPRSHEAVDHLARLRGSQCGCDAAEAFILYRWLL